MTAIAHLIKPKPKINWLKNRLGIDYFWKIVLRRVIQITQWSYCYKLSVNHWQFPKLERRQVFHCIHCFRGYRFFVVCITCQWRKSSTHKNSVRFQNSVWFQIDSRKMSKIYERLHLWTRRWCQIRHFLAIFKHCDLDNSIFCCKLCLLMAINCSYVLRGGP